VPAIANVRELCDAYYSKDLEGEAVPGFAFGDQLACERTDNEDYARDSDVVYHEYSHAVVDWSGIGLQDAPLIPISGPSPRPTRTTTRPRSPAIRRSERSWDSPATCRRPSSTLRRRLPDRISGGALHGAIWSRLLWDVRAVVRNAEKLEIASLDYLVDHPGSSHTVEWLDFWDAAIALFDATST
jgi:hypothetical protein